MTAAAPRPKDNLFVNRDTPIAIFKHAISGIAPEQARQVLSFYGVGGQGKTHLCRHLSEMLPADPSEVGPNLRWGVVDLHDHTERQSEYILLWVRNALKTTSKVSFPAFDLAFALFWKKMHGDQPLPFMENPWWEEISGQIIDEAAMHLLNGVPFVGSILGLLGRHVLKRARKELLLRTNKTLEHLRSGGRLLPAHEIKLMLPFMLAQDLDDWRAEHCNDRFIVIVDEYESVLEAGGAGSLFETNEFDDAMRDLVERCSATQFVFFSREKLRWDATDRSWRAMLDGRQHLLGGLSRGDAERFLTLAQVGDAEVRAAMIEGAAARDPTSDALTCYPIMLDMQVDLYRSLGADGARVSADDFRIDGENFEAKRHKLLSRLLRRYPLQLQYTLSRLSVARRFDEDIYRFIIGKFLTGQPADAWSEVQALSLVQQGATEGVHMFHNVMREGLLATLKPEAAKATHEALFDYFTRTLVTSLGEKIGAKQAAAAAEAFYHMEAVDPKAACSWWLEAGRIFRGSVIDRLVEDIDRANVALAAQTYTEMSGEYARCLSQLGRNLDAQGRYEEAEALYRRTLNILDGTGAGSTLTAANVFIALGIALDFQKKHNEAENFLRRSLTIRQELLEPRDKEIAMSLTAVGTNLNHQGLYTKAEKLIREALDIVGGDDPIAGIIFQNLGLCLGNQQRLREAEEMHRKALAVRERMFGPDHYRTGQSLAYLAYILERQGQPENAEPLILRALKIAKENYGLDHRETAHCFDSLGRILHSLRRVDEALEPYRQALAIRERVLGPSDPDTAASVARLGWTLYRARNTDAVDYLRRALEIRESVLGHDHPFTRISARQLARAEGTSLLKVETVIRGLDELGDCSPSEFSHVVSILDPGAPDPVWPEGWGSLSKLVLRFHDATAASPTATMFAPEHLEALLSFADQMAAADAGALVLHSTLGMSRSTACAVILQAHLESHLSGVALFGEILKTRDIAWPNLHIVELGDARLGRGGDLIAGAHAVYRYQLQKHPDWAERLTRAGRGREVAAAATGAVISL